MTSRAPSERAKLELLVRDGDGPGFELWQVSSAVGWLQMRPTRVADSEWELVEVTSLVGRRRDSILKNTRTDRFLMLTESERFLWDQMDGRTSLQDIATAYVLKYGSFDFDLIPALIRKLQRAELLTLVPRSSLRRVLARHRGRRLLNMAEQALTALERINISSRRVQSLFERLYRRGGFLLFTRPAALACVLLAVVGLAVGVWLWPQVDLSGLGAKPIRAILAVKLLFFVTIALHQILHGLALVHYGRRVREFGFTFLHGFIPTFYVDVTDIFMASQRARILTALSGALVHPVLGTLWFMLAAQLPSGFAQAFCAASGMIQWQAFLVALYPCCFMEMDGYHILVDLLGVPTLKADALAYVGSLLRGAPAAAWGREAALWVGYVVLSAISVAGFIGFNLWLIAHATS